MFTSRWTPVTALVTLSVVAVGLAGPLEKADAAAATCTVKRLAPVTYIAFDGHSELLTPWQGTNVAVLVEPGIRRSRTVMTKMVCALDRAWRYYHRTTGETPTPVRSTDGRTDVAEATSTCGAGCTFLGGAGTEIQTTYFEYGYQEIKNHNLYDQIPFYEFGRSFWFWTNQLSYSPPCTMGDPPTTGSAVWMRFRSMHAAGVHGAPLFGTTTPFATFRSQVRGLEGIYDANTSDTFAGTLCQNTSPGMYGGTDFWASIMMNLASHYHGQTFVNRFWHHLGSLPAAISTPSRDHKLAHRRQLRLLRRPQLGVLPAVGVPPAGRLGRQPTPCCLDSPIPGRTCLDGSARPSNPRAPTQAIPGALAPLPD